MKKLLNILKVSLKFVGMTAADLLSRALVIYAGMNNNPAYPNPPVDMPTFKAAIDRLQSAINEAADGSRKAIAECARQARTVMKILRQLGHYVEAACKEDRTVLESSGFTAVSTTRKLATPLTEKIRKITSGPNSGQQVITIVDDPSAISYEVRWAPMVNGVPGNWTLQSVPLARPPATIDRLTPGTNYTFQVRAQRRTGWTDWSDAVTRLCT